MPCCRALIKILSRSVELIVAIFFVLVSARGVSILPAAQGDNKKNVLVFVIIPGIERLR